MSSTFKPIPADSYFVRPIRTHKDQHVVCEFMGGESDSGAYISLATQPPQPWGFEPDADILNDDGTYQTTLFASLNHMFFNSASMWSNGNQLEPLSGSQFYVLNIPQRLYGEGIQPGTVTITVDSATGSIQDDSLGQLVIDDVKVGYVFYGLGIAAIQYASGSALNENGMMLDTGSIVDVNFSATHTIYEHTAICTMGVGELGYTINPSLADTTLDSGSVSDLFASGSLTPYMTTVGLYNNKHQLLAVAKFPRAIKRAPDSEQTIIIRFDV